jgi:hypothetical protein
LDVDVLEDPDVLEAVNEIDLASLCHALHGADGGAGSSSNVHVHASSSADVGVGNVNVGQRIKHGGATTYYIRDACGAVMDVIPVASHTNYMYRGEKLERLCLLEYELVIEIVENAKTRAAAGSFSSSCYANCMIVYIC